MGKSMPLALWILAALVAGVTFFILFSYAGMTQRDSFTAVEEEPGYSGREVLASVGPHILYASDVAAIRAGDDAVGSWIHDQLLACAAEEAGLENPAISRFVQERAKQLYLRDLIVEHVIQNTNQPTESEVWAYMLASPELFLLERHYLQIIAADSAIADSLHTRLEWGQNFQVTAQNSSLGQKAAIGGDLGFVTGGEMLLQGLPMDIALLDGLSEVVQSSIGWHIFKVSETRIISDSLRVMRSATEALYNSRIDAVLDSVLLATENRLSAEVVH
ncbi:MAG: peptidyl-prolyl cis-trans isomerase [Candidatus Sabulitectum sp.]|nr:peptidyl-prolyl cis-trans isomerase [Candidatus Sabulitectum sp.]